MRLSRYLIVTVALFATVVAAQPEGAEEQYAKNGSTEINVKNAEISTIIRIFSKKTRRNYILDERVKGKVSIYLPGKVSEEEAVRIMDSVLQLKGFSSVPIGENIWKIVPVQEARQTTIPTVSDITGRGSPSVVTRLINLKYVGADEVKQLLSPLVSSSGLMNAYTGTNSIILIDAEENIKRLVDIVTAIDVPFTDSELTIIPINHAEAPDVAEKINQILGEDDSSSSGNSNNNSGASSIRARLQQNINRSVNRTSSGGNNAPPARSTSSVTVSARARAPKIIADERTNSLIVVADEDSTARIRALVDQLDSPIDKSGSRFYVYRCQHASAEELAEVLSGLVGGDGGGTSGSGAAGSPTLGLNRNNSTSRSSSSQNRLERQRRTPGQSRTSGNEGRGVVSASLGEDVSVTADPATNSLIINAGKSDYQKILELLKQLDIKRRQVLVEALILEVGIDDSVEKNFEFISSAGGADGGILALNTPDADNGLRGLLSDPRRISQFSLAVASAGSLRLPGSGSGSDVVIPTQTALLSAVRNNSNVNVLSAPNILATDNEEAEIVVGENVPFISSTSTSEDNLNNTFNQVDRQDVGITLRITPQISSSNFVTLKLFTEVSNVIPGTAASELGPTTTVRTSDTTVITKNSQMVVIGGLMSDDVSITESGVPFLKEVPFIGEFFKSRNETQRRTNLLIFITPRIIKDQFDARDVTITKRDVVEDAIVEFDSDPPRTEFLRNPNIDEVIEVNEHDTAKPTTVLPPKKLQKAAEGKKEIKASADIELKVSPPMPAIPMDEDQSSEAQKPEKEVITSLSSKNVRRSAFGKYIVLEAKDSPDVELQLPFNVPDNNLIGIHVPAESSPIAKSFFSAGDVYTYGKGENQLTTRVLGIFPTAVEALTFYEGLQGTWYTLSPYEIMSLGSGPWRR